MQETFCEIFVQIEYMYSFGKQNATWECQPRTISSLLLLFNIMKLTNVMEDILEASKNIYITL